MLGTPTNARKKFPMVINNNRGTPRLQAATLHKVSPRLSLQHSDGALAILA